ncbi:FAD-binding oxidoreductase [Sulfobacillus harzensis]|uniref:FAD-binding oxidoreductase n=1 Tax=Sulfobacillus harzensis TaxID=2729629 RepID=A0A7Y0L541_9FIRM|nr:FAD-binding oxidoreductase [Sulfobacillus harzensis]NMP23122.1 FAD-binding oxidoreductase [Sulfobacillus harzensis]
MATGIETIRNEFATLAVCDPVLGRDSSTLTQFRAMHQLPLPDTGPILRPRTVDDIQRIVTRSAELRVPVVPRGGGSGVVEGIFPNPEVVVLDLAHLNRIGQLDTVNGHVEVEAGVHAWDLEQHLMQSGWTLGHWPQSIELATIGGLIATKSIGQYSTRYGGIEAMVRTLDVITGTGDRITVGHLSPRRTLGPELLPLFVGSEGTLGIIMGAYLKIHPLPDHQQGLVFTAAEFGDGLEVVRRWLMAGVKPSMVRLYDAGESARTFPTAKGRTVLLALFHGSHAEVQVAVAEATRLARYEAEPGDPQFIDHWLATRNDVSAWRPLLAQGLLADTLEISASWDRLANLHRTILQEVSAIPGVLGITAHASHAYTDGANLYFTFLATPETPEIAPDLYRRIVAAVLDRTLDGGGSIAHHHGVGRLRREWLARERQAELPYLQALKDIFDPHHILNRGALWTLTNPLSNSGNGPSTD